MSAPCLDDLVEGFRACTLPRAQWTHLAHLRVGAWHVHQFGPASALEALRDGIRKLNESHGTLNSPDGGYHETITRAYVQLLDGFLCRFDPTVALDERIRILISGPLAEKSLLLKFWSRASLMSSQARAHWTPPDLAPLEVPPEVLAQIRK